MGVGDYIHSREAGQLRPATSDASNRSRKVRAQQAKVDVPATNLAAPVPLGFNSRAPLDQYGSVAFSEISEMPQANENAAHRDAFDTDVEGVDDSTVAGTSIMDVEELQPPLPRPASVVQISQPQLSNFQQNPMDTRPPYQIRHPRRPHESNWYENLGDRAMKSAGFESDDADDDASQLTSLANEDERADAASDWYFSHKHRHTEEPLSRRLESFWSASKKAPSKPTNPMRESKNPVLGRSGSEHRKSGSMLPVSANRKITLSRSMTATPRTRFSPPKPSLLEQLETPPTRQGAGTRAENNKKTTGPTFQLSDDRHDPGLYASDNDRRDSVPSITAFDITNIDALEDDETIRDPFSKRRSSVIRIGSDPPNFKRQFEADYPPEVLYQKSFEDLQAEPFDHTPPTTQPAAPPKSPPEFNTSADDKVSILLSLSDEDRRSYLSHMSINEWEDCGDQLIDLFSNLLTEMKELRHARRKTAATFEAEIKRRHEIVETQSSELSSKLDGMRNGGAEVLRGRTP